MNIAMFGGSFDPVHNAHISLCNTMIKSFNLDKVVVVPANVSPFKDSTTSSAEHRLNMCRLAFEDNENVLVSDVEIQREGKSYTVDTLKFLKSEYPYAQLYLIMGADAFLTLKDWHKADEIFRLAHILATVREADDIYALEEKYEEYKAFGAVCYLVNEHLGDISSTKVRELIKSEEDASTLLPEKVYKYILEKGLYE